jgi:hypothetical protein
VTTMHFLGFDCSRILINSALDSLNSVLAIMGVNIFNGLVSSAIKLKSDTLAAILKLNVFG